jgi:hypothetical protein
MYPSGPTVPALMPDILAFLTLKCEQFLKKLIPAAVADKALPALDILTLSMFAFGQLIKVIICDTLFLPSKLPSITVRFLQPVNLKNVLCTLVPAESVLSVALLQ